MGGKVVWVPTEESPKLMSSSLGVQLTLSVWGGEAGISMMMMMMVVLMTRNGKFSISTDRVTFKCQKCISYNSAG